MPIRLVRYAHSLRTLAAPLLACHEQAPMRFAIGARRVGVPGVEPGTSSLSGTRSNQLSYTPFFAPLRGASKGKPVWLLQMACHEQARRAAGASSGGNRD